VTQEQTHDPAFAAHRLEREPDDAADVKMARPAEHPLGPLVEFRRPHNPTKTRLWAMTVLICSAGLLGVAAWLTPDPSGLGTHRQLGFPACTSVMLTGYPCPTCGMTTAFAHTVRGQFVSAFRAQPAGLLLALTTILAAVGSLGVLLTGIVPAPNWYRIPASRVVLLVAAVILLGWLYKVVTGYASGTLPAA